MQKTVAARIVLASVIVCASFGFLISQIASADTCPTGTQPATANDLANMKAAGITNPVVGMCWNPSSPVTGTSDAQAKNYLKSLRAGTGSCNTTSDASFAGLSSPFSICAAAFLQAYQAKYGPVTISSAYRTQSQQMCVCKQGAAGGLCGGAGTLQSDGTVVGGSNHLRGVAIDVNPNNKNYAQLNSFAEANPSYGVHFPLYSKGDLGHMEPTNLSNPQCSASAGYKPSYTNVSNNPIQSISNLLGLNNNQCSTGYTMVNGVCTLSSTTGTPQAGQVVNQDTICVISTNPTVTQIIPAGNVYPSGCLNSSQAYSTCAVQSYCSGNTIMSQSSSCATSVVQTCPYGCSNGACQSQQSTQSSGSSASTQGTSGTTASTQTSSTGGTTSGTTGGTTNSSTISSPTLVSNLLTSSSSASILSELANPQVATSSSTTTPIILNSAVANSISQLQANAPPGVTYAMPTSAYFPASGNGQQSGSASSNTGGTSDANVSITTTPGTGYDMSGDTTTQATNAGGSIATDVSNQSGVETFTPTYTSSDAGNQNSYEAASTFNNNSLSVLAILKQEVVAAIDFLSVYVQPFGGNVPSQMVGD